MSEQERVVQRLRLTLDLVEAGRRLMRQNLRRRFPQASEEELDEKFMEWLHDRPGAQYGDCVGRPCQLDRRHP